MKIEVKRKRLTFAMGQQKKLRSNLSQRIAASLSFCSLRSSVQKNCTKGHKMLGFRSRGRHRYPSPPISLEKQKTLINIDSYPYNTSNLLSGKLSEIKRLQPPSVTSYELAPVSVTLHSSDVK